MSRLTVALPSAGYIDRVTPQIIGEPALADDPRDERTAVGPYAKLQRETALLIDLREQPKEFETRRDHSNRRIIRALVHMQAYCEHIGIADGLDLLQSVRDRAHPCPGASLADSSPGSVESFSRVVRGARSDQGLAVGRKGAVSR
jgi:hypothetical protein